MSGEVGKIWGVLAGHDSSYLQSTWYVRSHVSPIPTKAAAKSVQDGPPDNSPAPSVRRLVCHSPAQRDSESLNSSPHPTGKRSKEGPRLRPL